MRPVIAALVFVCALGLTKANAEEELRRLGMFGTAVEAAKPAGAKGVVIVKVLPKSSADEAGLQVGDTIQAIDGKAIEGIPQFLALAGRRYGGDKLKVAFVRDGKERTVDAVVQPRPLETSDAYSVVYGSVSSKAGRMRTILTKPRESGRRPALFIIQGIGGYSVDRTQVGPGMYAPFTDAFTKAGFVTFRVEKPGQGDSEGPPTQDVDFDTELDAYRQGLKALKTREDVDPENVFIFGHSMGGVMGPLIAAENPVKGVAAYGTLGKTWIEYMLENIRRQSILSGEDPGEVDEIMAREVAIHYLVLLGGKSPEEVAKEQPHLAERIGQIFQNGKYMAGRNVAFFRQLQGKNISEAWAKLDGHALAIWGDADFVSSEADHQRIAQIVNMKTPGHGRALTLKGVDHGFMAAASQRESQERFGQPGGEFQPIVVQRLLEWAQGALKEKP